MTIELKIISLDLDSEEASRTAYFDQDEITIGRAESNDVILDRPEVSAEHARIRLKNGFDGEQTSLFITDLGSIHGTRVEDLALYPNFEVGLSSNERIVIGNYLIRIAIVDSIPEDYDPNAIEDEVPDPAAVAEAREIAEASAAAAAEEEESKESKKEDYVDEDEGDEMADDHVTIRVEDQENIIIDFNATAVFTISGVVTNKGRPLEDVKIDGGSLGRRVTGSDGRFVFEDVNEDTEFEISAMRDKYRFEYVGNVGTVVSNAEVEIIANRLCTIKGRVVHKGKPLAGVEIDGGVLGKVTTDSEGYYSFPDVAEDTEFELSASKDGFVMSYQGVTK